MSERCEHEFYFRLFQAGPFSDGRGEHACSKCEMTLMECYKELKASTPTKLEFMKSVVSCQCCGSEPAITYHQNTRYVNEIQNYVTLCPDCKEENDEYWTEMWSDFYSTCLV